MRRTKEILFSDYFCALHQSLRLRVFGEDIYSDEYFMAWNYALYVERLAQCARAVIDRPLYVNAAMNSGESLPFSIENGLKPMASCSPIT